MGRGFRVQVFAARLVRGQELLAPAKRQLFSLQRLEEARKSGIKEAPREIGCVTFCEMWKRSHSHCFSLPTETHVESGTSQSKSVASVNLRNSEFGKLTVHSSKFTLHFSMLTVDFFKLTVDLSKLTVDLSRAAEAGGGARE